MPNENQPAKEATLTVAKEFDAPIHLVFEALANPDALADWWGPMGYKMTVTAFNFQPHGICLFKMENEENIMWARFIYEEIKKPDLVAFILSFSNEAGGLTQAPFFDNWPREIRNVITLAEKNGKTTLTNNCFPVNATPQETASFAAHKSSFNQGFSASLEKLTRYLSKG